MRTPQSQFTSLIVIVAALALVGGITIVLVTSRDSLERAPELWFGSQTQAPLNTLLPPSPTPTATLPSPTPTVAVATATRTPRPTLAPSLTPTVASSLPEGVVAIAQVALDGVAARLRDAPNGRIIGALLRGTLVQVLAGSQELEGVTWVQVRAETGETGWMAANLLEVVEAPQGPAASPAPGETAAPTALPTLPGEARGLAVVKLDSGTAARLRDAPGGRVIGGVADGAQVKVLQGRVVQDGVTWVEIEDETGLTGWISERLLIYATPAPA